MKIIFSCIHFPIWPYPPKIMIFKNSFRPVNSMGWQVCILSKFQMRSFFFFLLSYHLCWHRLCRHHYLQPHPGFSLHHVPTPRVHRRPQITGKCAASLYTVNPFTSSSWGCTFHFVCVSLFSFCFGRYTFPSLCIVSLLACQVRVTVGDSVFCCCGRVMSFEH